MVVRKRPMAQNAISIRRLGFPKKNPAAACADNAAKISENIAIVKEKSTGLEECDQKSSTSAKQNQKIGTV